MIAGRTNRVSGVRNGATSPGQRRRLRGRQPAHRRRLHRQRRGSAAYPDYAYGYDGAGNRTSRTVSGTPTTYTYNDADQLTSGGATHDGNGNLTGSETAIERISDFQAQAMETHQRPTVEEWGGVNDIVVAATVLLGDGVRALSETAC